MITTVFSKNHFNRILFSVLLLSIITPLAKGAGATAVTTPDEKLADGMVSLTIHQPPTFLTPSTITAGLKAMVLAIEKGAAEEVRKIAAQGITNKHFTGSEEKSPWVIAIKWAILRGDELKQEKSFDNRHLDEDYQNRLTIVDLFLDNGALHGISVNAVGERSTIPRCSCFCIAFCSKTYISYLIHMAAYYANIDILSRLIRHKADLSLETSDGLSVTEIAQDAGDEKCLEAIRGVGAGKKQRKSRRTGSKNSAGSIDFRALKQVSLAE